MTLRATMALPPPSPTPPSPGRPATTRQSAGVPPRGRPPPRAPGSPLHPPRRMTPPRTTAARTDGLGRIPAEARTVAPFDPKGRDRLGRPDRLDALRLAGAVLTVGLALGGRAGLLRARSVVGVALRLGSGALGGLRLAGAVGAIRLALG